MARADPESVSPRWVWSDDLATAEDIGKAAEVKAKTVGDWARRHPDAPIAVKVTSVGRIWIMSEWIRWLEATGRDKGKLPQFAKRTKE